MSRVVTFTFIPAVAFDDQEGNITEPIITIYNDVGSPGYGDQIPGRVDRNYAFPFLTRRLEEIYANILYPFDYEIEYTPELVSIRVYISSQDDYDLLKDQVNFDVAEGEGWGDLTLDGETLTYTGFEDGGVLYIPLLNSISSI